MVSDPISFWDSASWFGGVCAIVIGIGALIAWYERWLEHEYGRRP